MWLACAAALHAALGRRQSMAQVQQNILQTASNALQLAIGKSSRDITPPQINNLVMVACNKKQQYGRGLPVGKLLLQAKP